MHKATQFAVLTMLTCFAPLAAEDTNPGLFKKAETNYDQMRINSDNKDVRQSQKKLATAAQKEAYMKEWALLTEKQHTKTRNTYGADSDLTENARARHQEATEAYENAREKHTDASRDLKSDQRDAKSSKDELSKDMRK